MESLSGQRSKCCETRRTARVGIDGFLAFPLEFQGLEVACVESFDRCCSAGCMVSSIADAPTLGRHGAYR